MKILLLTAHSIAEHDDLRMFHEMGHEVLSIGAYLDPANPSDDKRPALPQVPKAPQQLTDLVADQMVAKSNLPETVLEWADTVIVHHFPAAAPDGRAGWITGNWARFTSHRNRVIWRTCGQSNHIIEQQMAPFRPDGLQIVRYSPKEENLPYFAGQDAMIRFGKEPDEWTGWTGEDAVVGNVTQDMKGRGDACGYWFWVKATDGLPVSPAGPGSQEIGGVGALAYDDMRAYLRRCRAYLYTGTQPASYTLGLIEAMMTGVPVVSIGPKAFGQGTYVEELFEGHEIVANRAAFDDPDQARGCIDVALKYQDMAADLGAANRAQAIELFGMDAQKAEWAAFLA